MNNKTAKLLRKVNTYTNKDGKVSVFKSEYKASKKNWKSLNRFEKEEERKSLKNR